MANETEQEVVFLNSAGEEVSNDPRWLARKTLAAYGGTTKAADFDIPGPYDHLDGVELKALTKDRGISTKGFRKASQFRDVLEAWDEEHDDEADSDDESDDSNKSSDSDDEQE